MNYYNENNPYCVQWLRNLIAADLIPAGDVDPRSIQQVQPKDLHGYVQCHFFAGIAGWSLALQLAGWPSDRPIWTGSCPCQPFSCAGKRLGTGDPRHLWPDFFRLVQARRPVVVMGEQVAGKAGWDWFDGVADDLEGEGFQCRAVSVPACAVGASQQRERLWWVARLFSEREQGKEPGKPACDQKRHLSSHQPAGNPDSSESSPSMQCTFPPGPRGIGGIPRATDGISRGVDAIRAYGNSIVPPLAAEVIMAFMEAYPMEMEVLVV